MSLLTLTEEAIAVVPPFARMSSITLVSNINIPAEVVILRRSAMSLLRTWSACWWAGVDLGVARGRVAVVVELPAGIDVFSE